MLRKPEQAVKARMTGVPVVADPIGSALRD
jgi:hypothetical protein